MCILNRWHGRNVNYLSILQMDWIEIAKQIFAFIIGGGLTGLGFWGLNRRQKKGEVAKLESEVRKLEESEFRDRATQLVKDLSDANATIERISGELQAMIARQADSDIKIAHLEAKIKRLEDKSCKKYCACLDFERYEEHLEMSAKRSI